MTWAGFLATELTAGHALDLATEASAELSPSTGDDAHSGAELGGDIFELMASARSRWSEVMKVTCFATTATGEDALKRGEDAHLGQTPGGYTPTPTPRSF